MPTLIPRTEFYHEAGFNNSQSDLYEEITIEEYDQTPALVDSVSAFSFLAKDPEGLTYDNDGNLTSDDRWNYEWDGEQRLIATETKSTLSSSLRRQRFEFSYDWMGEIGRCQA